MMAAGRDVNRLGAVLSTLLSPLAHDGTDLWQGAVCRELCGLVGADSAALLLPSAEGPTLFTSQLDPSAGDAYQRHYGAHDVASRRMTQLGLPVAHARMLWRQDEARRSEVYNDYIAPNNLHDAVGLRVQVDGAGLAGICLHHDRERDDRPFDRHVALLRTVLPAFEAGVSTWHRLGRSRTDLARLLDTLSDGILVCDRAGRALHANTALSQLLATEPERERVRTEIDGLAGQLAAQLRHPARTSSVRGAVPAVRTVRTSSGQYRLRGTYAAEELFGPGVGPMILVAPTAAEPLGDAALHARFGLTEREVQVARLLGEGLSNAEIAARLGVRPFTARNHTERVLHKFGVSSRARVGAVLREGVA